MFEWIKLYVCENLLNHEICHFYSALLVYNSYTYCADRELDSLTLHNNNE